MIERKVTNTRRDESGKIIAVGNPHEWWSPRPSTEVINDIEESFYRYYVVFDGKKILLEVANGTGEKYLRTNVNTSGIKLDELPGC